MTTEQNMAARLARIMGDVGRVEKKGKITSQGSGPTYKFTRDADVLEKVGPMMADAGIIMVPERQKLLSMDLTLSGKQVIANIRTDWHVTDGKESIRFQTFGQGADSGDKALPKAQSNARKYAFFMLYHIVTGDDPDQHASDQPERSERTPAVGRRAGAQSATTSAPAPIRTPEEQQLRNRALDLAVERYGDGVNAAMKRLADEVGVPKGESATVDQLHQIIALIETPSGELGSAAATAAGSEDEGSPPATSSEPAPAPTLDDVLEAAGPGAELIPPKPKTPEYDLLPAQEKAKARAYWQTHEVAA